MNLRPPRLLPSSPVSKPLRAALWRHAHRFAVASAVAFVLAQPAGAAYLLAPEYAGTFNTGTGANAAFYRIDNAWAGSAVLWDETNRRYGSGVPVSSFSWGTGLWGQVDWQAVQNAAAGQSSAASGAILQSFEGLLPTINQANSRYLECYSATWGPASLVPFFTPAAAVGNCDNAEAGAAEQQNWTAHYTGFIRITDPGEYNFSVLHDDGFFFRLMGADGAAVDIGRDYLNPRDRVGFAENLALDAGLYGFELGAWNRLGAGVVDLRWTSNCTTDCAWTLVPTENLVAARVPEPPALLLVLSALALLSLAGAAQRRRTSRCTRLRA